MCKHSFKTTRVMFDKEHLKKAFGTFVVVLAALAVHQLWVAPHIHAAKKPAVKA